MHARSQRCQAFQCEATPERSLARWPFARKTLESGDRLRDQTYDSTFEADYAAELGLKRRGGLIESWERQVNIPLMAWGKTICHYKTVFKVLHQRWERGVHRVQGEVDAGSAY